MNEVIEEIKFEAQQNGQPQLHIKLRVILVHNKKQRFYKLLLHEKSLNEMKSSMLKHLKLRHKNVNDYLFWVDYCHFETPIYDNEDDFYRMLHDLLSEANQQPIIINIVEVGVASVNNILLKEIDTLKISNNIPNNIIIQKAKRVRKAKPELAHNEIGDPRYIGAEEVFCKFCKESNLNLEVAEQMGRMYGPVFIASKQHYKNQQKKNAQKKRTQIYFHEQCAIWTPKVYLHETTNKLMNLAQEVKRCNKTVCKLCSKLGAGVGCLNEACRNIYHIKCVNQEWDKFDIDDDNFEILCPIHAVNANSNNSNNNNNNNVNTYKTNIEYNCAKSDCAYNKSIEFDDVLIICDTCDVGHHIMCLRPPLLVVPEEEWYCDQCLTSKSDTKKDDDQAL